MEYIALDPKVLSFNLQQFDKIPLTITSFILLELKETLVIYMSQMLT
jgi:hypothetical protein